MFVPEYVRVVNSTYLLVPIRVGPRAHAHRLEISKKEKMAGAICDVKLCGHRTVDDHTQFVLKVSYGSMRSWEVYKRYSQFENMHWALREELSGSLIELPPLPPKKFCGSMDPAFLDEREEQLQDYLVQLLQLPGVMEVETFLNFVEDPNEESVDHDE